MINNVTRLPDAYAKDVSSNNYKLFELAYLASSILLEDITSIGDSRDVAAAYGATLDLYGSMFGVERQGATDEQFRTKILNQIGKLVSTGDCNSVLRFIAQMLNTDVSKLHLDEDTMLVSITGLTMEMLQNSGYKSAEMTEMIQDLLPIGVGLVSPLYAGTLYLSGEIAPSVGNQYPVLTAAWLCGQVGGRLASALVGRSDSALYGKVGLDGDGEVPAGWLDSPMVSTLESNNEGLTIQTSGTYEGGTLGIATGDDEEE